MKVKSLWFFALIAAISLAGCGMGGIGSEGGSVKLAFANRPLAAMFVPDGPPLVVDSYTISGTGPAGNHVDEMVATDGMVIESLIPGSWTFHVEALDSAGGEMGDGNGTVPVLIGQQANLHVDVNEFLGNATSLNVLVGWEPNIVDFPLWVAEVSGKDGIPIEEALGIGDPLVFDPLIDFGMDVDLRTAESLNNVLPAGFYALILQLWDAPSGVIDGSAILSTGAATIARMAQGRTTTANFGVLHSVQGFGAIDIVIDPHFENPIVLGVAVGTPDYGTAMVYTDEVVNFTATAPVTAVFAYYLRGQLVHVGAGGYTVTANDLSLGDAYRLDVIAFSDTSAGCGTWTITRQATDPETLDMHGTLSSSDAAFNCVVIEAGAPLAFWTAYVAGAVSPLAFSWPGLPAGTYEVRGFRDVDGDHIWDVGETYVKRDVTISHASGLVVSLVGGW